MVMQNTAAPSPTATTVAGGAEILQLYLNYMLQYAGMSEERRQFDAQWGLQMREFEMQQQAYQQEAAARASQLQAMGPVYAAQADAIRAQAQMSAMTTQLAKEQWAKEFELKARQVGIQEASLDLQRKVADNDFWLAKEQMKQQAAQFAESMGLEKAKVAASLSGPSDWVAYNTFINYQKPAEGQQLSPEENPFAGLGPSTGSAGGPSGEGPYPNLGGASTGGGTQTGGKTQSIAKVTRPAVGGGIPTTSTSRPGGFVNQGMQGGLLPWQKGEGGGPALTKANLQGGNSSLDYAAKNGGLMPPSPADAARGAPGVLNPMLFANRSGAAPSPTDFVAAWTADGDIQLRDKTTGALKKVTKLAIGGYVPQQRQFRAPASLPGPAGAISTPPPSSGPQPGVASWTPAQGSGAAASWTPDRMAGANGVQRPPGGQFSTGQAAPNLTPVSTGFRPTNAAQAAAQLGGVSGIGSTGAGQQPPQQQPMAAPQLTPQQQQIQALVEQGQALGLKGDRLVAYMLGNAGAGGNAGFPQAQTAAPTQVPEGWGGVFPNGMPEGQPQSPQQQYQNIWANAGRFRGGYDMGETRTGQKVVTPVRNSPGGPLAPRPIGRTPGLDALRPDLRPPAPTTPPTTGRPQYWPKDWTWPPPAPTPQPQPGEPSPQNPYNLPINGDGSGFPWGMSPNPPAGWAIQSGGTLRDPNGVTWGYNQAARQWTILAGNPQPQPGGPQPGKQLPQFEQDSRNPSIPAPSGQATGTYNGMPAYISPTRQVWVWSPGQNGSLNEGWNLVQGADPALYQHGQTFANGGTYPKYAGGTGKKVQQGPAIVGDLPRGQRSGRNPEFVFRPMGPNHGMYERRGQRGEEVIQMRPGDAVVPERKMPAYMRSKGGKGKARTAAFSGMPRLAGGGFIPTISHDYNPNTGVIKVKNPAVSTNNTFTSGDQKYTANQFKQIPLLDKLRGAAPGMTRPGAGGQNIVVENFAIGRTPATLNIRDLQRFLPSEIEMSKGLYEDLFGMSWDDVIGRSVRQSPAGQRFQAARYG